MCILFIYKASDDVLNDYSIILAANRDESFDRPSECMLQWSEDLNIYGGKDLEPTSYGGAWLALNTAHKKIGVLLNLPGKKKENSVSRGKVVANYVKCESSTLDYIESLQKYDQNCNDFLFVTIEFGNELPNIKTYSNASGKTDTMDNTCLGFGNSLPDNPLTKIESGKVAMNKICSRLKKSKDKEQLIKELMALLKSEETHLPDPQLEIRQPNAFKQLSSIFVSIPARRYGTRTHTIFLLTKTGQINLIEATMQSPIDTENPIWKTTEFNICTQ